MKKWDAVNSCFKLIAEREKQGKPFSIDEVAFATGWKAATVRTYVNKRWGALLVSADDGNFRAKGIGALGLEGFKALHSQKVTDSIEPFRPKFSENVDCLIDKSRDAALLAVATFNNPFLKFRSHGYIVQMIIAWTSLLHAIFERKGEKYFYTDKDGKPKTIDGEYKAWDLAECIKHYWKDKSSPVKSNLEFFIGLRNKVEHRFLPALDVTISGKCQSLLLNYENLLVEEFGSFFSLNSSLAIWLQLTQLSENSYKEARKALHSTNYKLVEEFITNFDKTLPAEISQSQDYQIKVYLVPRLGNHASSSDVSVQYVKYDPSDPASMKQYEHLVAFIKEKPSSESIYKRRPQQVVDVVKQKVRNDFGISHHTNAWKLYGVRPRKGETKDKCKREYCGWVEGHEGFLYTDAFGLSSYAKNLLMMKSL